MKPYHAAALALVGWYLMLPCTGHPLKYYDPTAPLSAWFTVGVFDTANECDAVLREGQEDLQKENPKLFAYRELAKLTAEQRKTLKESWKDGQCIATDDPRLKENSPPPSPPGTASRQDTR
jgi:hypothetical protein